MKKRIVSILILFCLNLNAETTGDLDKTYGTKGLVTYQHGSTGANYHLASVLDSSGRLLVLNGYGNSNNPDDLFLVIYRFLPSGAQDFSYSPTVLLIDAFLSGGNFSLVIDDFNGVFLGYSNYTCTAPNTECQQDIYIKHYSINGSLVGSQTIAFDYGSTYLRQNDKFADMVFIPDTFGNNTRMLAIAATVDYSNVNDTDFGVVLLDVSNDGSLYLRTSFSSDGKATCAFDQDIIHNGVGVDVASSIALEFGSPLEFIIGGSAFEGNGANNDGWNLAFCKFNVLGTIVQSFSTQPLADTFYDVEILQDMYYSNIDAEKLIVATKFSTGNDNDFVIGEYLQSSNNWQFNNSFGTNGWASVGFNELFIGDTNDVIQTIAVEPDKNITVAGTMQWQDGGGNYSKIALARFNQLGVLNTNWGINGSKVHDFSGVAKTQVNDMVYDFYEKELYFVGQYPNGSFSTTYIANVLDNPDLIFLSGFE